MKEKLGEEDLTVNNEQVPTQFSAEVSIPSHYRQGTFEVIDEMLMVFGPQKTYDFCILNAWKYRSRAPYKNNMEQDMQKANRYMQMAAEIMHLHPEAIQQVHFIKDYKKENW